MRSVDQKRRVKSSSSALSATKDFTTRICPITSAKRPEAMSICSFFSPSRRCHFTDVSAVSHTYTGNTMISSSASGHAYQALITSTAAVVISMVAKELENIFAKLVISVIERFRRATTVPVTSLSNQRWGRCSSLS